jgi:adenosylcobinamide-phosphate synthase
MDIENRLLVLFVAILADAAFGEPIWLWQRLPHPVVVTGKLVGFLDKTLNHNKYRIWRGFIALGIIILLAGSIGLVFEYTQEIWFLEPVLVAVLIAQRSLYQHVLAVLNDLEADDIAAARHSVGQIVGRDVARLTKEEICRAAIETSAENLSDGVVAPVFWYLLAGLPGIFIYKAINTADSMVGYRNERYHKFGFASARADDIANFIPARITGLLIAMVSNNPLQALQSIWRDASCHPSPNAGWPEAAMAGALDIALAGPRRYAGQLTAASWINADGRKELASKDIAAAMRLVITVCIVQAVMVIGATMLLYSIQGL